MIPSELFITDLVGVMFWFGFKTARAEGKFRVSLSSVKEIWTLAQGLFTSQAKVLRTGLSPRTLKSMAKRLWLWLSGEVPADAAHARGEIAATACMAWLLAGHFDGLSGPMGQIFVQAIRDRYPDLASASIEEIADFMRHYDASQLEGVISLIKGRMFELYVIEMEDGHNGIRAISESDMNHPGDDIILHDDKTGHEIFVQLKATDSPSYIEAALRRYPDIPIWTTEEVSHHFSTDDRVISIGESNAKFEAVTHDNFNRLVHDLNPISAVEVASGALRRAQLPVLAVRSRIHAQAYITSTT